MYLTPAGKLQGPLQVFMGMILLPVLIPQTEKQTGSKNFLSHLLCLKQKNFSLEHVMHLDEYFPNDLPLLTNMYYAN